MPGTPSAANEALVPLLSPLPAADREGAAGRAARSTLGLYAAAGARQKRVQGGHPEEPLTHRRLQVCPRPDIRL